MKVEVVLRGSLVERLPGGRGTLELPEGATVDGLRPVLGLPGGPCVYVVNGTAVGAGSRIADGDRVEVFPPMAGGQD